MSMSTYVIGIKSPTEEFQKKLAVYRACKEAGIDPPEEILKFFAWVDFNSIDPGGMEVPLEKSGAACVWEGEGKSGFEVDISKLPAGVTRIRFYNSW